MIEGWIEKDEAPLAELPEWARASAPKESGRRTLVLDDEGLAAITSDRGTMARWADVIDAVVVNGRVYLLLPRRPPHPPWIIVKREMLPPELAEGGLDGAAKALVARASRTGYREARTTRPAVPIAELKARILAKEPVPGTVEVHAPPLVASQPHLLALASAGCVGAVSFVLATSTAGPHRDTLMPGFLLVGGIVASVVTFLVVAQLTQRIGVQSSGRVLALSPDGCVAGALDGVHAYAWDQVDAFRSTTMPGSTEPALEIVSNDGSRRAVPERFYRLPIPLILALVESYRRRALGTGSARAES